MSQVKQMVNLDFSQKDEIKDTFYMIDRNGERTGKSISFEKGTVKNIEDQPAQYNIPGKNREMVPKTGILTTLEVEGDDNATALFEFLANYGVTTSVEWTHVKVGNEESGDNILGTLHEESVTDQNIVTIQPTICK
jgi:hypothetical protein